MSVRGKILITEDIHPLLKQGLEAAGFAVDDLPHITAAEVFEIIQQYEGVVINSKVYIGKEMLDKAAKLKFACRAGSGLEVIDVAYAHQKGVSIFNSAEGNRTAVAEHALGMLLNIMNNISVADEQVRRGEWKREENRGHELTGKTVALIGYGNTAQAFAKLLRGFDVRVLAYDKYYRDFGDEYVQETSLERIFEEAEILSLHLPLTPETTYMIDAGFLSRFKKPYWLINTSRGKVLDTAAMLQLLKDGKIQGAALDVLENEKINTFDNAGQMVFNRLVAEKRVLITPHIAGWTMESKKKIAETLLFKISRLYNMQA